MFNNSPLLLHTKKPAIYNIFLHNRWFQSILALPLLASEQRIKYSPIRRIKTKGRTRRAKASDKIDLASTRKRLKFPADRANPFNKAASLTHSWNRAHNRLIFRLDSRVAGLLAGGRRAVNTVGFRSVFAL